MEKVLVKFLPDDVAVCINSGETLMSAAAKAGLALNNSCGGAGTCGKCLVKIIEGKYRTSDKVRLSIEQRRNNIVFACQTQALSHMTIEILDKSRRELVQQVMVMHDVDSLGVVIDVKDIVVEAELIDVSNGSIIERVLAYNQSLICQKDDSECISQRTADTINQILRNLLRTRNLTEESLNQYIISDGKQTTAKDLDSLDLDGMYNSLIFELSQLVPPLAGAIYKVDIDATTMEVSIQTVGKKEPIGFCLTGLVECIAEMVRVGILDSKGSFRAEKAHQRLVLRNGEHQFIVAWAWQTPIGTEILLKQQDVYKVLQEIDKFGGINLLKKIFTESKTAIC